MMSAKTKMRVQLCLGVSAFAPNRLSSCSIRKSCLAVQSLVDIIKHGLTDENQKVKTIASLSIAALAEAAAPYGIESFDDVLEPLWKGIRLLRCALLTPC